MNKIRFEFFKSCADVASAEYDSTDKVLFIFPAETEGYLSIGPRLMRVEGAQAEIDIKSFSDGVHTCYLCIGEGRFELPSFEKLGRLFRMSQASQGSPMARVNYLKELEGRIAQLEERLASAEEKIYGRKVIL